MKKLLTITLACGLLLPAAYAQKKTDTAKEKPAAAETKPAASGKKKETPPAEVNDPDKELVAAAKKEADALTPTQQAKLMEMLNKADAKTLEAVEGIGEVRAKAIIKKRPFAKAEDAARVDGVGIETFKNLCASVKPAAKTEKPAAKETEKPAKEKTTKPETKPAKKETTPAKKPA
jgi:DNA uptake protein ComE-like DNA-binding protein